MNTFNDRLLTAARETLNCPTAPYREQAVRQFIIDFCFCRDISVWQDEVGNLMAIYGEPYQNTDLAFSAHMDHPGFIAQSDSSRGQVSAVFYGGVETSYFAGSKVKFFTENGPVGGTVSRAASKKTGQGRAVRIAVEGTVRKGELGMWDIPACRVQGDRLYSRACDDLVGCVSVLSLLDELHRRKVRKKVTAVFTTAEEAGLQGAKHLCVHQRLPESVRMIAIETSSVLPHVKMGDGAVVRVGDRSSLFTPALTDFLLDCAHRAASQDKSFRFQRKLMDAGTCESTIYNRFGYINAAVCIPLGHYHNRNVRTGRIAAEYVSLSDLANMVKLFLSIVKNSEKAETFLKARPPRYRRQTGPLGEFFYE
jgi:endoglucanase